MQIMKKKVIIKIVIFVILVFGIYKCHRAVFYNRTNHLNTFILGEGVFEEKFQPFSGGVLMSDTYSYYLTDSTKFRILLGQCDEKELYRCVAQGDSIKAVKHSRRIHYGKETPIDSVIYSIKELKREGNFE
jgi:hypothetical protein